MNFEEEESFGDLLAGYRTQIRMSQQKLADCLGVTRGAVVKWEQKGSLPKDRTRIEEIVRCLKLAEHQRDALMRAALLGTSPTIWHIPYHRNPLFTGREEVLEHLHSALVPGTTAAVTQPQAISGLGGVGKTQVALEYAYRYRHDYQAVLWLPADSQEALVSGFAQLAQALNLPEQQEQDQSRVIDAVRRWLRRNRHWLLIVDNVEDLLSVQASLPPGHEGCVLLTTRAAVTEPVAFTSELGKMTEKEAILFLLRRIKALALDAVIDQASEEHRALARSVWELTEGLPLALDQAGAYILETGCGLAEYLDRYQQRRADLLSMRGKFPSGHPESVWTTFSLIFEKVEQLSESPADLLRVVAFLHPKAIPEEIFIDEASHLGPTLQVTTTNPLALDQAMLLLRSFSLIQRNTAERTVTIHRLVQAVLREMMSQDLQRLWAERTVRAVSHIFPSPTEPEDLSRCQRYLLHAQACADEIRAWDMEFEEAACLLTKAGAYLYERAEYFQAERYFQQALTLYERLLGSIHPAVAEVLNHLGVLYRKQNRYAEAESVLQKALDLRKEAFGAEHLEVAESLQDLAGVYKDQGRYEQAEPLYRQALAIQECELGSEDPIVAKTLHNLSGVYEGQGAYNQAEILLQQAAAIWEKALGPDHHTMAGVYNNLAHLYYRQRRHAEAVPLHERARAILEEMYGPEHPDVAQSLNNLAAVYLEQGKLDQAEALLQRVIAIYEQIYGNEHREMATSLGNLATFYYQQRKYTEAESLYRQALEIYERVLGPQHLRTGIVLHNLAGVYKDQGKYRQAEPLYQRTQTIHEQVLGPQHPDVARNLNNLADLYRLWGRYEEAEPLYRRALAIRESALGPDHFFVALSLNNLSTLLLARGQHSEIEPMLQRALRIWERELGPEDPNIASCMNNLAKLYTHQGKYEQAAPLYQRALSLYEHALGPDHPNVALCLSNVGELYDAMGAYEQAELRYQRALSILEQGGRVDHPHTAIVLRSYAALLERMKREAEAMALKERAKRIQDRNVS